LKETVRSNRFSVLFEDNHLLIVSKPAGMLSQGDKTGDKSLLDQTKLYVKNKYKKPGAVFLGLPHRLDRPVSGAIVLCRTSKALKRMSDLIQKRELQKTYLAISQNQPPDQAQKLLAYIKKNKEKNRAIIADSPFEGAKEAILNYKYLGQAKNRYLLRIQLITGRPHQIRAQLNFIDCPILGDLKYHRQTARLQFKIRSSRFQRILKYHSQFTRHPMVERCKKVNTRLNTNSNTEISFA